MSGAIQHCGILIIAAGQSKRLGQPKQLLNFEGKLLINRLVDIVKAAGPFPITIVLGANAQKVKDQLIEKNLKVVINENWEQGMASSISVGLESIINDLHEHKGPIVFAEVKEAKEKETDGVMILVCDQPFITKNNIQSLLKLQQKTTLPMAACYYEGVLGTPALFHESVFDELLTLKGDIGAKKIIQQRESEVAKLHFDQGALDIDTMEDYHKLLKQANIK